MQTELMEDLRSHAPILRTPVCNYRTPSNLWESDLWTELKPNPPKECDYGNDQPLQSEQAAIFNGYTWTRLTAENWQIPIIACVCYIIMLVTLKAIMRNRQPIRLTPLVIIWNFSLSAFSFAGMVHCVPHLLWGTAGLITQGPYTSVCAHAGAYGHGKVGFFVALFIYSKLAELVDTMLLLLRKSPVILLHWYHHVTVLLYCWHAYSVRIGTGLWFAAMNYTVHCIMYFYFGLTQCGPNGRRVAKKFAMLITMMQLSQMLVGIAVTLASVYFHFQGEICYVSLSNSALGLVMYASYFVLFLQLFLSHYVFKKKSVEAKKSPPSDMGALARAADATTKGRPLTEGKRD